MEIKTDLYNISYDATSATIYCQGVLRLNMEEYASIVQLLEQVIHLEPPWLTLDLRQLEFLNSSGFTTVARFVAKINAKTHIQMKIRASYQNPWHQKSLNNFKRLMPRLELEFE